MNNQAFYGCSEMPLVPNFSSIKSFVENHMFPKFSTNLVSKTVVKLMTTANQAPLYFFVHLHLYTHIWITLSPSEF